MEEHEQHVKRWYADLCAKARQLDLKRPTTPCDNCGRPRSEHNARDENCTSYVTSLRFRNAAAEKETKLTADAVAAIETLAAACGWTLP